MLQPQKLGREPQSIKGSIKLMDSFMEAILFLRIYLSSNKRNQSKCETFAESLWLGWTEEIHIQ